jgi:hypothetical protein
VLQFGGTASRMSSLPRLDGSTVQAGPASDWLSATTVMMKRYGNIYNELEQPCESHGKDREAKNVRAKTRPFPRFATLLMRGSSF